MYGSSGGKRRSAVCAPPSEAVAGNARDTQQHGAVQAPGVRVRQGARGPSVLILQDHAVACAMHVGSQTLVMLCAARTTRPAWATIRSTTQGDIK